LCIDLFLVLDDHYRPSPGHTTTLLADLHVSALGQQKAQNPDPDGESQY
jgi:hypothetical protein